MFTHMHTHAHTCTHIHAYIHTHTHAYMYIHLCVHMYVNIHTFKRCKYEYNNFQTRRGFNFVLLV